MCICKVIYILQVHKTWPSKTNFSLLLTIQYYTSNDSND